MQRPASPRPIEAAARFCVSCVGTVACWAVWIVLGLALGLQLYVISAQQMPVPDLLWRRVRAKLADAGLDASFGRGQFDPSGKVLLEKVRLRSRRYEDPLFEANGVYVRKGIWSVLSGERTPDEIRIDRATLSLPAQLSPSGLATPLVQDLSATLRLDEPLVHVDQLAFRIGKLVVTARGDIQLPAPSGQPARAAEAIERALQVARQIARELPALDLIDRGSLNLALSVRPGIGNVAAFTLTAEALRDPTGRVPVETGAVVAHGVARLDGRDARPLRLEFTAENVSYADHAEVKLLAGSVVAEIALEPKLTLNSLLGVLAAGEVQAFNETADAPVLDFSWRRGEPTKLDLRTALRGEALALSATGDLQAGAFDAQIDGRVAPALVDAVLPARSPKLAPYFRFGDPVRLHGAAAFTKGWQFAGFDTRVWAGRLNSSNVQITSARGRISVDPEGNFLAYDAVVQAGVNHARGTYWMNFRSFDYRMLLEGALRPPHIAGWFRSNWWLDFWSNFSFVTPPSADVDVGGCWRDVARSWYFGSTDTGGATVLGADFEQAHARVFVRPNFAHAFDLRAQRAGGEQRASGWFKRVADPQTRELTGFAYDLEGNLAPDALRHLGGRTAEDLLKPFVFGRPPQIAFQGETRFAVGKSIPDLRFSGHVEGGLSYEGFPLDSLDVTGGVSGDQVRLDRVTFNVSGGSGTAKASLSGEAANRRLGFDVYVADADMVRALGAVAEFERARRGGSGDASPNRELLKRASGGKLQFALSANGNPEDIASFEGSGNVQLTGAELGEIHLFGLLSQVLSGLSLNFSSLKLDTMRGSFRLAHGQAQFPDLRVTGPTALIEGKGAYRLKEQTLDFAARLRPYEESRNIFTAAIGMVLNPLTSILELRLTGPIAKPNWSISLGSSDPTKNSTENGASTNAPATNKPSTP